MAEHVHFVQFVVVLLLLFSASIPISMASPLKLRLSAEDVAALEARAPPSLAEAPTTFFEVDRPHRPPPGSVGPCSTLLLSHSFGFTYTKPPVTAAYSPPPCLAAAGGRASAISLAVLEWRATCRGVQFDRIFGVWLAGVELLRSCTAEPRPNGVVWSVSKDVTKYASLLAARNPSTLAVYLGNLVDDQYTGVYDANVTLHLYFRHPPPPPPQPGMGPADVVVPISRSLPLNDGLWFQISGADDVGSATLAVPANAYRAVLEVYLSYHSDDEFWYTNTPPPNGNGPFREVTVSIDGDLVGAVWPFPVIYTGGINPLLWRPITGIGSFNLPSYDIELTAFLGRLLDGEAHEFSLAVTNAQDVWYVDANLHLWLDPRSGAATTAGVTSYDAPATEVTVVIASDELFYTTAFRHIVAEGWVQTPSYGKITATWTQRLSYENTVDLRGDNGLVVNQSTGAYAGVHVADHAGVLYSQEAQQSFPLYIYVGEVNQSSSGRVEAREVQLGLEEEKVAASRSSLFWSRTLSDAQSAAVTIDNETWDLSWGTHQTYRHEATDGCYFRDVASSRYIVVSDHSDEVCVMGTPPSASAGGEPALVVAA